MIGIDTNVLLRFLLADDTEQSPRARTLVAEYGGLPETLRLADVVLVELAWVLPGIYGFDRSHVVATMERLLDDPAFAFSDRLRMQRALDDYRGSGAGFADCLIAQDNAAAGCTFTATFDRKMRNLPSVQML